MASTSITALMILTALALAGCDGSDSPHEVGYDGYTATRPSLPASKITPPSSGTSNGTAVTVPTATR